jgi:hypothetical protein
MAEHNGHDTDVTTLERMRDSLADTMQAAAHTIHEQVHDEHPAPRTPAQWGLMTSEGLERLSEDIRHWDVLAGESRLRNTITNRPALSLLMAGLAGMLLGRMLRSR